MQVVWRPGTLMEAQLGKQLLLAEGVFCYLAGEHLSGGLGELPAFGLYALMVEPETLGKAEQVLRDSGMLDPSEMDA
jgi:hypothetical protein